MENKNTIILVTAFVMIIVGIALIGVISDQTIAKTTKTNVASETISLAPARIAAGAINTTYPITVANAPSGWQAADACTLVLGAYGNSSATFTQNTDYTFSTTNGTIFLFNTVVMNGTTGANSNTTSISYQYCANDYIAQGWERAVLNLVPGFFALVIMLIGVALMYMVLKSEGLLNI